MMPQRTTHTSAGFWICDEDKAILHLAAEREGKTLTSWCRDTLLHQCQRLPAFHRPNMALRYGAHHSMLTRSITIEFDRDDLESLDVFCSEHSHGATRSDWMRKVLLHAAGAPSSSEPKKPKRRASKAEMRLRHAAEQARLEKQLVVHEDDGEGATIYRIVHD